MSEIRDKFDHIVAEHERALQLHRRVARRGILETVLLATADVIAAIKTGQFVDAARAALEIRNIECLLTPRRDGTSGSRGAYLVRAKEQFGV